MFYNEHKILRKIKSLEMLKMSLNDLKVEGEQSFVEDSRTVIKTVWSFDYTKFGVFTALSICLKEILSTWKWTCQ